MNTQDLKEVFNIAAEERRLAAVRCTEWVEELAKSWERRAKVNSIFGTEDVGDRVACAIRKCIMEMRRACSESSSTGALTGIGGDERKESR